jgi:hypothetical protein
MNLFLRLASRPEGAKALLDSMLIDRLVDCQFLRQKPVRQEGHEDFASVDRFNRLMKPIWSICAAMLLSLGSDHPIVPRKVVSLLKMLHGVIEQELQDFISATLTLGVLEEQKELICLLSLLSPHRHFFDASVRLC